MKNSKELEKLLLSIDHQGYSSYKSIKGEYSFLKYILCIDHVQADPYAPPSKIRIVLEGKTVGLPIELIDSKSKKIAVSDFLTRNLRKNLKSISQKAERKEKPYVDNYGGKKEEREVLMTGNSGEIFIDRCTQEILERTSVLIKENRMEVRLELGLPAAGRRVLGRQANDIFQRILPVMVEKSCLYANLDKEALSRQVTLYLDQEYIQNSLEDKNLVAFIANGSVLPRKSGVNDSVMIGGLPFKSPKSLEVSFKLPSGREIFGMGIEKGVSLIVGGGYHGKSTLLKALERGVYHHIEGDGREFVLTCPDAVKIRAEDGRSVEKVNISPFINNLPGKKDTEEFSTENASGSTSQAANVMEALESGTTVLLIDEDTSATNFMIRDFKMQKLIAKDKEPITPFVDKVRSLYKDLGISTILIVGGCGDYFDVADRVIMMDEYVPKDVTKEALNIAKESKEIREKSLEHFGKLSERIPLKEGFSLRGREDRWKARGRDIITYGRENIDLSCLEQLVDDRQTNALAVMMDYFNKKIMDDSMSLSQAADKLYAYIKKQGLDGISPYTGHPGNMALPRKQEFCAAINRYRGLKVRLDVPVSK